VLRRLCRYGKAWRDFQWPSCKLSSLAIMACMVDILDKLNLELPNSRDDLAILHVCEHLADRLNQPIPNPVMAGNDAVALDRDWKPEERSAFVAKAKELYQRLIDALRGTDDPAQVLKHLQAALGDRVTSDVAVIRVLQHEATVKSFSKVTIAPPVVRRSTSG